MKKSALLFALALSAGAVWACELCETQVNRSLWDAPHRAGVAVSGQYSKYDRSDAGEDAFEGYNTQFAVAHRFADRLALQVNVPYLDRELDGESESGVGDIAALVLFRAVHREAGQRGLWMDFYAGVKAPTGNTDPLRDERGAAHENEAHEHASGVSVVGHGTEDHGESEHAEESETGGHSEGHHLALGSGSWDGIFGVRVHAKQGHWQAGTEAQYVACTEGDYDFEYGDEFFIRACVRYHLWVESRRGVAIGADASREWQDENEIDGAATGEGESSASYVGPAVEFSWAGRWTATAAWDFAVEGHDKGLNGAADERLRASVGCIF